MNKYWVIVLSQLGLGCRFGYEVIQTSDVSANSTTAGSTGVLTEMAGLGGADATKTTNTIIPSSGGLPSESTGGNTSTYGTTAGTTTVITVGGSTTSISTTSMTNPPGGGTSTASIGGTAGNLSNTSSTIAVGGTATSSYTGCTNPTGGIAGQSGQSQLGSGGSSNAGSSGNAGSSSLGSSLGSSGSPNAGSAGSSSGGSNLSGGSSSGGSPSAGSGGSSGDSSSNAGSSAGSGTSWSVIFNSLSGSATDRTILSGVALQNCTDPSASCAGITMRYWVTVGDVELIPLCSGGCSTTTVSVATTSAVHADHYIEVAFAPTAVLTSGQFLFNFEAHRADWATLDETADWSYPGSVTAGSVLDHVTVYLGGNLIWGVEP